MRAASRIGPSKSEIIKTWIDIDSSARVERSQHLYLRQDRMGNGCRLVNYVEVPMKTLGGVMTITKLLKEIRPVAVQVFDALLIAIPIAIVVVGLLMLLAGRCP